MKKIVEKIEKIHKKCYKNGKKHSSSGSEKILKIEWKLSEKKEKSIKK